VTGSARTPALPPHLRLRAGIARGLGVGPGPIFHGWRIILLASIVNGVGGGLFFQAFTVFYLPLKQDFGVSSAAVSLLYAAARLEGGLEGPLVGYLISKLGARAMILAGVGMSGFGMLLLAMVPDYWSFFFIYILVVSLGYNAGFFHPLSTLVNYWFVRHRGVGLAWVSVAANAGGMVLAPLLSLIILRYGWRAGAATAGALLLLVGIPAALPIRSTPESMGLRPDGAAAEAVPRGPDGAAADLEESEMPIRRAVRTRIFWMLLGCLTLRLSVTVALNIHLVPLLVWGGMGEATAAYVVSFYAFCSIVATLAMGWAGDRWGKPHLCGWGLVPLILSMVGMILSPSAVFLYGLAVGLAVAMGTAPLNWALIGDLFGRASYPTLRGVMAVSYGSMTFVSPIFAGWIHDTTGSYTMVLAAFAVVLCGTAAAFSRLNAPAPPRRAVQP
jgi:sugar phosphate permease